MIYMVLRVSTNDAAGAKMPDMREHGLHKACRGDIAEGVYHVFAMPGMLA
jgi:hypothetical protein